MNLLIETKKILKDNGKSIHDIKWIGTYEYYMSIKAFIKYANVEYDNGFGAQEVASDLIIVGEDFWLERHEYDGSECWEFKQLPSKPNNKIKIKALTIMQAEKNGINAVGWLDLYKLNFKGKDNAF